MMKGERNMKLSIPGLLIVAALVVTGAGAHAADNMLANGDFEEGKPDERPAHWNPGGWTGGENYPTDFPLVTATKGRTGKALAMTRPDNYKWTYAQQAVEVPMDRDGICAFTVWLRSDQELPGSVDLVLLPTGEVGKRLPQSRKRMDVGTSWEERSISMNVSPMLDHDGKPLLASVRVIVQLYKTGTIFADDAGVVVRAPTDEEKALAEMRRQVLKSDPPAYRSPVGIYGGMIATPTGKLLLAFATDFRMCRSTDGGETWSEREELDIPDKINKVSGAIRMRDGTFGIWTEGGPWFWKSKDRGRSWSKRVKTGASGYPYAGNSMIETSGGRLILPVREGHSVSGRLWEGAGAFGITHDGRRVLLEGHAHALEMDITLVHYSDDKGETWKRSSGDVIIWKDDGYGGMWPCDEPNVAELSDGRLLMFIRTTLGRLYQTWSDDEGVTWAYPEATVLPSSYSPCSLKRIPDSTYARDTGREGDLLVVWNNVSADEIKKGWRRGRLSSAISRDNGETWEHVRTLDTGGLSYLDETAPLSEPGMTRADNDVGKLPIPFGTASYPDIIFAGENVLVKYHKRYINPELSIGTKLMSKPLDWFYGDE